MASARVFEVCLRFGVPMTGPSLPGGVLDRLGLTFEPGRITLVSGPSGAGKSRVLAEIKRRHPEARRVHDTAFPLDVPVIDAVLPTRPIHETLALMTACGLGEPTLWIRPFETLSDGERFRAQLARAIGQHQREGSRGPLLCDEFGSLLHERLARALAFTIRKLVTRERMTLVVATSREDVELDLAPDRVVRLPLVEGELRRKAATTEDGRRPENGARSIFPGAQFHIEPGGVRDYAAFAAMHYRQREQLGFVDRVFVLRDAVNGEPLGIVVYGHPALELGLRNRVTAGRWVRQADRLNAELRVLKRLVIHPDLRGCGLGHWLVRQTLPLTGVAFVECLAAMGAVNPVFEKAGMVRVGACLAPANRRATMRALQAAGADPFSPDFVSQVCRRPVVRRLVAGSVFDWYRASTSSGEVRVRRQSPSMLAQTFRQLAGSEPVYFIWARDGDGWALIRRGLGSLGAETSGLSSDLAESRL